jgi:hypothetical protein
MDERRNDIPLEEPLSLDIRNVLDLYLTYTRNVADVTERMEL